MRNTIRVLVSTVLLLSLVAAVGVDDVSAAATTSGTLQGTVVDNSGNPLPGATVILRSKEAVRERAVLTDAGGNYFASGLAPGDYTVIARFTGFTAIQQTTTVALDQVTRLNFSLPEGEISETVTVVSERPVVSKTQTEGSYNLRKDYTETIPVARSYQSLLALAPGVSNTGENDGNPNILGASRNENTYLLDGVSITDTVTGSFGSNINYDSIEEVDVKLTGVSAEYGQFQGGLSNVITKSGGNDFTGSVRDEITSPSFESQYGSDVGQQLGQSVPARGPRELSHDVETTLGGPIVRNSAWFFISYNRNDTAATDQLGNPTGGVNGDGIWIDTFEGDRSQGKLTWQVTNNHKAQYNYFEDPALTPRCYGQIFFGGPCYDTPFIDNQQQGGFAWTGTWNAIWTSRIATDVRASHWQNSFDISPLTPPTIRPDLIFESPGGLGAGLAAGHPATIENGSGSLFDAPIFASVPEIRERDQYEIKSTAFLSTGLGTHTLKIGADYQEATRTGASVISGNALAYFDFVEPPPGLGGMGDPYDIDNRVYDFFIDFAAPGSGGPLSKETAIYVQDDWALNNHWSLNLGVRIENFQEENDVGEKVIDQSGIAPRLGATYDIGANGKYLVKATAARYLAGVKLTTLSPFVRAAGGQSAYDIYSNGNLNDMDPLNDAGTPDWVLLGSVRPDPDAAVFDPDLETQSIDELTLSYEQALTDFWGIKFKLIDREWNDIIGQQFTYDYTSGVPVQNLFMTNVDGIERSFQGLFAEVEKRFSNSWSFRANLTYGEAEGNDESGTGFSTYDSFGANIDPLTGMEDPMAPRISVPQTIVNRDGTLTYNEEMAIKIAGSYQVPLRASAVRHSLELGAAVNWSSGNNWAMRVPSGSNVVVGPGPDGVLDCFNAADPYLGLGTLSTAPCAANDQTARVATVYLEPRGANDEPEVWTLDFLTRYRFAFNDDVSFEARFEVRNLTDEQEVISISETNGGNPAGFTSFQRPQRYLVNVALLW